MRDVLEQQVVELEPIRPAGALVAVENPYMALAQQAMTLGKVDQLDRLLDLQLRWEAEQARKAYVAAMAAFKAEPMEILKRKRVSFETRVGDTTSYTHAELSDVTDVVVPAMGKHGLSHRWDVKQEGGQITVTCTITHAQGHSESVSMTAAPDGSGKKNPIQQVASANSYLQRYTLLAATGMATKGMDDDAHAAYAAPIAERISDEQEVALRDLVSAYVNNQPKFLAWCSKRLGYAVEKLSDIRIDGFDVVQGQLRTLAAEKGGQ